MKKYPFIECPNPEYSFEILFSDFIEKCAFRAECEYLVSNDPNKVYNKDCATVNGFKNIEEFKYFFVSIATHCLMSASFYIRKLPVNEQVDILNNIKSNLDILINEETHIIKDFYGLDDNDEEILKEVTAFKNLTLHENLSDIHCYEISFINFSIERFANSWKEILMEIKSNIDLMMRPAFSTSTLSLTIPKAKANISVANLLGLFKILSDAKLITVSNVVQFTAQISELFSTLEKESPSPKQCKNKFDNVETGVYTFWKTKFDEIFK